jgi:hypothetical protein
VCDPWTSKPLPLATTATVLLPSAEVLLLPSPQVTVAV